ncbi:MAG: hypothetical protein GY870_13265 [archaeon]|nr:hypothetical protein [archaeon]
MKEQCSICGATAGSEWYKCCYCGAPLCSDCIIECDKCHNYYCISSGRCGDEYIDEVTDYHFCYNCK